MNNTVRQILLVGAIIATGYIFASGDEYDKWPGPNNKIGLVHRWSFESDMKDSVGISDAILRGTAELKKGSVSLKGGVNSSSFVDIPGPVVPCAKTPFTLEIWATMKAIMNWSRIFTIYFHPEQYGDKRGWSDFCWIWTRHMDGNRSVLRFKESEIEFTPGFGVEKEYHIVLRGSGNVTTKGYDLECFVYERGNDNPLRQGKTSLDGGGSLVGTMDCLSLGKSLGKRDADACAEYNEVRIWNRALSNDELAACNKSWANAVPHFNACVVEAYDRPCCPEPQWFVSMKDYVTAYSNFKVANINSRDKTEANKRMGGVNDYRRKMVKEAEGIWKQRH